VNAVTVDYLFRHAVVVTMADAGGCGLIEDGAVAVKADRIVAVGETKQLEKLYPAHREIDASGKLLMPGLVDAHMHTRASLWKGLAQDSQNWLADCSIPYREALDGPSGRAGSMVMIAEALKAGTTTFVDQNEDMCLLAENHLQAGTRALLAQQVHGLPPGTALIAKGELYPLDPAVEERLFAQSRKLVETCHMQAGGRLTCAMSPLGPDRVSKEMLLEVGEYARKNELAIHMHLACGERETDQMERRYHKRSIPLLDELGLLNERLVGIHLSVATDAELRRFAQSGAAMVLCSGSEAIVDGNIPPAYEFNSYSPKLAIGSDQTSGGNTSNLFYEMKVGALLNKCKFHDPEIWPAWKMLRLATIDGARAIGMGHEIGSLEVGKKADLILLDLQVPHMAPQLFAPLRNLIPNLVYAANGSEVVLSMIDGKLVMEDRKLLTLDERKVVEQANIEGEKLLQRAKKALFSHETAMNRLMRQNKL